MIHQPPRPHTVPYGCEPDGQQGHPARRHTEELWDLLNGDAQNPVRPNADKVELMMVGEAEEEAGGQGPPRAGGGEAAGQEEQRAARQAQEEEARARAEEEEGAMRGEGDAEPVCRQVHHLPSLEAQQRHRKTHLPYRPWCRACVAARKPNWPHLRSEPRSPDAIPEVHLDYCYMRNNRGSEALPVVVLKERDSRALAAHAMPYKGGDTEWTVKQIVRDMRRWEIKGSVIMRSDQEDALLDLVKEVVKARTAMDPGVETHAREFDERSPVGESASIGFIESGIRTVEGMVRTLKFALEENLQIKVSTEMPIFAWLIEHAADLCTKYSVGVDGLSAYERLKKKPCEGGR